MRAGELILRIKPLRALLGTTDGHAIPSPSIPPPRLRHLGHHASCFTLARRALRVGAWPMGHLAVRTTPGDNLPTSQPVGFLRGSAGPPCLRTPTLIVGTPHVLRMAAEEVYVIRHTSLPLISGSAGEPFLGHPQDTAV